MRLQHHNPDSRRAGPLAKGKHSHICEWESQDENKGDAKSQLPSSVCKPYPVRTSRVFFVRRECQLKKSGDFTSLRLIFAFSGVQ